jgi:hypothetical protein
MATLPYSITIDVRGKPLTLAPFTLDAGSDALVPYSFSRPAPRSLAEAVAQDEADGEAVGQ